LIDRGRQEAGSKVDAAGNKVMQLSSSEDRDYEYRKMRLSWGYGVAINLDQVEAVVDDSFRVVGLLELSRRDPHPVHVLRPPTSYFHQIYDRQIHNNTALKLIAGMARQLGCPAYYVLYNYDLKWFCVQDIIAGKNEWYAFSGEGYKRLIMSLPHANILSGKRVAGV